MTGRISTKDLIGGVSVANTMNAIILEAIWKTDAGRRTGGVFTVDDVRKLNTYIRTNYLKEWTELHGDDENAKETGDAI